MTMFSSIWFIAVLATIVYLAFVRFVRLSLWPGVPGEKPELLFGNIRQMGVLAGGTIHLGLQKWRAKFGNCFLFFVGHQPHLVFVTATAAKTVWSQRHLFVQSPVIRERFRVMGDGCLITLDGDQYKRHLRTVGPIFKLHKVMPYLPVIVQSTDLLLDKWAQCTNPNEPYNAVMGDLKHLILEVFGQIAFGYNFNCLSTVGAKGESVEKVAAEEDKLVWALRYLISQIVVRKLHNRLLPETLRKAYFRYHPKIRQAKRVLYDYLEETIRAWETRHGPTLKTPIGTPFGSPIASPIGSPLTSPTHRASVMGSKASPSNRATTSSTSCDDSTSFSTAPASSTASTTPAEEEEEVIAQEDNNFLSRMLASLNKRDGLSRQEIVDELIMFVVGGFESTSTLMAWLVYYLSINPDKQQKMQDEIRRVLGDSPPTKQTLDQLEYSGHLIKEVLRIAPIIAQNVRTATADTEIDGVRVKAGTTVMIATHALQNDPEHWRHDPTQFLPERFAEQDSDHDQNVWAPFGGGQRGCIGQQLARMEAKVIAVRMLQRFTFKTAGNSGGFHQEVAVQPKALSVFLIPNSWQ